MFQASHFSRNKRKLEHVRRQMFKKWGKNESSFLGDMNIEVREIEN